MEGCSRKDESGEGRSHGSPEEKKLELRLVSSNNNNNNSNIINNTTTSCGKRGFLETVERNTGEEGWIMNSNGNQNQKQAANNTNNNGVLPSPWSSSDPLTSSTFCVSYVPKKNKKISPTAVVGWPPIRSFRKNLASSSSSKPANESQDVVPNKIASEKPVEVGKKGLFVKINMDGVPIGRKVDLTAYDSYEKLSSAVDELFRGLLAAQRDSSAGGIQTKQEEEKTITGLLDGSGEYTLVYEDNEGDRVLVGDVPWQ
ncbi:Auxin-responsive protein IAA26 [Vitis vinifera]|uniref:Auxin-responsive protein n=1 Tax=Vitis vinifera TaxID=29760 RepID=A0A438GX41_VITVI|nr:Auxin-responsive protein IAA26 [Vitis vinifera]